MEPVLELEASLSQNSPTAISVSVSQTVSSVGEALALNCPVTPDSSCWHMVVVVRPTPMAMVNVSEARNARVRVYVEIQPLCLWRMHRRRV